MINLQYMVFRERKNQLSKIIFVKESLTGLVRANTAWCLLHLFSFLNFSFNFIIKTHAPLQLSFFGYKRVTHGVYPLYCATTALPPSMLLWRDTLLLHLPVLFWDNNNMISFLLLFELNLWNGWYAVPQSGSVV